MKMEYFKRFRLSKEVLLLIISMLVPSFVMGYSIIILSIYLYLIHFTVLEIGIVSTIQMIIAGILMIPLGRLSDLYGRKKFLLLSRSISMISWLIFIFTVNYYVIFMAMIIRGIGWSFSPGSYGALLSEKTTEENRNYAFSVNSFGNVLAASMGSAMAILPSILAVHGWNIVDSYKPLFIIAICMDVLATFILSFNIHEKSIVQSKKEFRFWPKKSKKVILKFSVVSLIGLGAGVVIELFSLWFFLRFHVVGNVLGPIYAISSITLAISFFVAPYLAEKIGSIKTIVLTQILAVILLIFIPLIYSLWIVATLFIIRNLLMNISAPIQTSFLMSIVSPDERGSASSITTSFHTIPRAFGPAIGGYLMNMGDLSDPFFITAILYLVSATLFYIFFISYNKKRSSDNNINR